MYKINDKVYVFLKGTHNNAIALNGLHRNRFGTIIDIRENIDKATYIVKMDITDKEIMVQEDHGIFTFYDICSFIYIFSYVYYCSKSIPM